MWPEGRRSHETIATNHKLRLERDKFKLRKIKRLRCFPLAQLGSCQTPASHPSCASERERFAWANLNSTINLSPAHTYQAARDMSSAEEVAESWHVRHLTSTLTQEEMEALDELSDDTARSLHALQINVQPLRYESQEQGKRNWCYIHAR